MNGIVALPVSALLLLALSSPAGAATWTVLADGTGDAPTIPTAIALASSGDTVLVGDGTWTDLMQDALGQWVGVALPSGVALRSLNGPDVTAIDATDEDVSTRGVSCIDCTGTTLVEGFTITGGDGYDGTAVYISGGHPVVRGNVFYDAYGGQGGSVSVRDGAAPTIEENLFDDSYACCGPGGAILIWNADAFVRNNVFTACSSAMDGGAISVLNATAAITGNLFTGNSGARGGAIHLQGSTAKIEDNDFEDNHATSDGGAVAWTDGSGGPFERNAVVGNTADGSGGGLYIMESSPTIRRTTIVSNAAVGAGGGVLVDGPSDPSFAGVITAFNAGDGGVNVAFPSAGPTFACCDTYGNEGGEFVGFVTDPTGIDGNVAMDPMLCLGSVDLQECSPFSVDTPCGPVGARGVGCECQTTAVEDAGWGKIKARYRTSGR